MTAPVYLITGFGRCGTSLIMQILNAGGLPCTGEYPTFEAECPGHWLPSEWWAEQAGRAVKVLNIFDSVSVWSSIRYRAIWMDRDADEQAKSQAKFNSAFLPPEFSFENTRSARRRLAASLKADRARTIRQLADICGEPPLIISFEDVLKGSETIAERLREWSGLDLDVDAMRAQVVARDPKCYKGFLEMELMEKRTKGS